jgi:hypothetical protein
VYAAQKLNFSAVIVHNSYPNQETIPMGGDKGMYENKSAKF